VSNTLQPLDYITISSDVGIIAQEVGTVFPDTVTIDLSSVTDVVTDSTYYYNNMGAVGTGYTIGNSQPTMTITSSSNISGMSSSTFQWKTEEFVDCLPNFDRVKSMCEKYPGFRIAYEKFVTTYKLVKDDYDNTKD
jgi:hypothetical protein